MSGFYTATAVLMVLGAAFNFEALIRYGGERPRKTYGPVGQRVIVTIRGLLWALIAGLLWEAR